MLCRALAAGVLSTIALPLAGCAGERPPNVLMIVVDTLRRDHLGCYGYPRDTSPSIDRFAAGAVRYADAYAAAPWTTPSVGALLTARYPSELGIVAEPDRLDDRFVLLSEVLAGEGYDTGAVVGHYFVNSEWNFHQGFDLFDESNVLGHAGISSPGITRSALAFLRQPRERPFFLFVHYFDPHYDYVEHPGHRFSDPAYDGPAASGVPFEELLARREELGPADRAHLVDLYDSEIAFTDEHVGRLLAALDEAGLADDTVVVFTADHGEEIFDRGALGHGHSLYQEQIAVPLIVRYPGGEPAVVEQSVGLVDLYPTLLAHLGVAIDHPISGRSFLGAGASGTRSRLVFSESEWGFARSAVVGRSKLVYDLREERYRMFDLAADPGETADLVPRLTAPGGEVMAPAASRALAQLRHGLDVWMQAMERARHVGSAVELGDEERAELRALGYLRGQ